MSLCEDPPPSAELCAPEATEEKETGVLAEAFEVFNVLGLSRTPPIHFGLPVILHGIAGLGLLPSSAWAAQEMKHFDVVGDIAVVSLARKGRQP